MKPCEPSLRRTYGHQTGARDISGATLAVLILRDGRHHILWAGDSRVYRRRAGQLTQLSRDHSVVQDLIAAGLLSVEEAAGHPQAHVITRAIGVAPDMEMEVAEGDALPGDTYLLCSDGLSDMVADADLARALAVPDLAEAADGLIAAALARGAPDNVTCILVRC